MAAAPEHEGGTVGGAADEELVSRQIGQVGAHQPPVPERGGVWARDSDIARLCVEQLKRSQI